VLGLVPERERELVPVRELVLVLVERKQPNCSKV
jgi:hypothetical protein